MYIEVTAVSQIMKVIGWSRACHSHEDYKWTRSAYFLREPAA